MTYKIVGLGEMLWDMFPEGKKLGGAPANFAYHTQALGMGSVQSFIASSIGDDKLGNEIAVLLDDLHIDQRYLGVDSAHPTGTVTVELDKNGTPAYIIDRDVAWDYITHISTELAQSIDAVCFGTLAQRSPVSKNTINQFLTEVPETALKIFDINLRQSYYSLGIIKESLELANVLKINDEELVLVGQLLGINAGMEYVLQTIVDQYGLKLGILTQGDKGSTLISDNKIVTFSGFKVPVQDSVGAGDAFTAAVALGMLRGYELDDLNKCANKLAAYVCTKQGATPAIPDEISRLFQ